jgi:hypothetical protein
MSIVVNDLYGSYVPAIASYVNQYGVTNTKYGVISITTTSSAALLLENGSYMLQENGGKILLG